MLKVNLMLFLSFIIFFLVALINNLPKLTYQPRAEEIKTWKTNNKYIVPQEQILKTNTGKKVYILSDYEFIILD